MGLSRCFQKPRLAGFLPFGDRFVTIFTQKQRQKTCLCPERVYRQKREKRRRCLCGLQALLSIHLSRHLEGEKKAEESRLVRSVDAETRFTHPAEISHTPDVRGRRGGRSSSHHTRQNRLSLSSFFFFNDGFLSQVSKQDVGRLCGFCVTTRINEQWESTSFVFCPGTNLQTYSSYSHFYFFMPQCFGNTGSGGLCRAPMVSRLPGQVLLVLWVSASGGAFGESSRVSVVVFSLLWGDRDVFGSWSSLWRLQCVQNAAARPLVGGRKTDHNTPILESLCAF